MLIRHVTFVVALGLYLVVDAHLPGPCGTGHFFVKTQRKCFPCEEGKYMDKESHQFVDCFPCSKGNVYDHTKVVNPCNASADSVLGCYHGYCLPLVKEYRLSCQRCPGYNKMKSTLTSLTSPMYHAATTPSGQITDDDKVREGSATMTSPQDTTPTTQKSQDQDTGHESDLTITLIVAAFIVVVIFLVFYFRRHLRRVLERARAALYGAVETEEN